MADVAKRRAVRLRLRRGDRRRAAALARRAREPGVVWIGGGIIALGVSAFVATLQRESNLGRIQAAYGGIFVRLATGPS